jgi:hypothetical protein
MFLIGALVLQAITQINKAIGIFLNEINPAMITKAFFLTLYSACNALAINSHMPNLF